MWTESFVGITNEVAIEFLRWRVGVCGGGPCLLMVLMNERGRERSEFWSLLGEYGD